LCFQWRHRLVGVFGLTDDDEIHFLVNQLADAFAQERMIINDKDAGGILFAVVGRAAFSIVVCTAFMAVLFANELVSYLLWQFERIPRTQHPDKTTRQSWWQSGYPCFRPF